MIITIQRTDDESLKVDHDTGLSVIEGMDSIDDLLTLTNMDDHSLEQLNDGYVIVAEIDAEDFDTYLDSWIDDVESMSFGEAHWADLVGIQYQDDGEWDNDYEWRTV